MEPRRINLADPDFEPTDEELLELTRRAFADTASRHAEALVRLEQAIAERRRAVLERFAPAIAAARQAR